MKGLFTSALLMAAAIAWLTGSRRSGTLPAQILTLPAASLVAFLAERLQTSARDPTRQPAGKYLKPMRLRV